MSGLGGLALVIAVNGVTIDYGKGERPDTIVQAKLDAATQAAYQTPRPGATGSVVDGSDVVTWRWENPDAPRATPSPSRPKNVTLPRMQPCSRCGGEAPDAGWSCYRVIDTAHRHAGKWFCPPCFAAFGDSAPRAQAA